MYGKVHFKILLKIKHMIERCFKSKNDKAYQTLQNFIINYFK